eukprot:TRINITY_DN19511_c0_g1_i1.p1 TRINITY_DN19511_c0_g1~~TRINITY_DN19511_c0_g1_i1.p1  ORF type:complete len:330 (+),score=86.10 TRINITY_DN19511_c0_g1_i1:190-1179(+)
MTSVDPLSCFMFKEGLARFCTEEYQKPTTRNMESNFMHLTNYAINKTNDCFEAAEDCSDGDSGFKRSLSSTLRLVSEMLCEGEAGAEHREQKLWNDIEQVCVKTILAGAPGIAHMFKALFRGTTTGFNCFEVLGFDVMLDETGAPWMIEVNNLPSFETETSLDVEIKESLITNVLTIVGGENMARSKYIKDQADQEHTRLYGDSVAAGAAKKEFLKKALGDADVKGRKLSKGEKNAAALKQRQALLEMESNRKKCAKNETREAHQAMVRERLEYEDANLGGFVRIFPSSKFDYSEFETGAVTIERDTTSLKKRKEEVKERRAAMGEKGD